MADESVVASIIPWQQPKTAKPRPKRPKVVKPRPRPKSDRPEKTKAAALDDEMLASETLIMPDFLELVNEPAKTPVAGEPGRTEAAASAAAAVTAGQAAPASQALRETNAAIAGEVVPASAAPPRPSILWPGPSAAASAPRPSCCSWPRWRSPPSAWR
ncbi:hypothetical protein [Bradyrhizobium sp.]|uniref:hypothetical protein n=1 Tax=Bradyrhizobium sp. TaxID=376 RepID=UPI0039187ECA